MNTAKRSAAGVCACLLLMILSACGDAPTVTAIPPTATATALPATATVTPEPTPSPATAPAYDDIIAHINAIWAGTGTAGERKIAFDAYTDELAGQSVVAWSGWLVGLDPAGDGTLIATISVDDPFSATAYRVLPTPNPADTVLDVHVPEYVRLIDLSAEQTPGLKIGNTVNFSGIVKQVDYYFDVTGKAIAAQPDSVPTPAAVPADLLITMERTPCLGPCPAYKLSIAADGTVSFEGISNTKVRGKQTATIPAADVAALVAFFDRLNFAALPTSYSQTDTCPRIITDAPGATVAITRNGQTQQVMHYHGNSCAPIKLLMLENKIDEVAASSQWVNWPYKAEGAEGQ